MYVLQILNNYTHDRTNCTELGHKGCKVKLCTHLLCRHYCWLYAI